jgi:hypothetical protein
MLKLLKAEAVFLYEGKYENSQPVNQFLHYNNGLMHLLNSKGYKTIDDLVDGYSNRTLGDKTG